MTYLRCKMETFASHYRSQLKCPYRSYIYLCLKSTNYFFMLDTYYFMINCLIFVFLLCLRRKIVTNYCITYPVLHVTVGDILPLRTTFWLPWKHSDGIMCAAEDWNLQLRCPSTIYTKTKLIKRMLKMIFPEGQSAQS